MFLKERQQIVILCVAGVMLTGFVLLRYLPLRKQLKAIEQRQAEEKIVIDRSQHQLEQLPGLTEQLMSLQKKFENYQANLPSQRQLGTFLHKIADLMDKHNLREQLTQPGKEIQADNLKCIPVNIHCKGKLTQIFKFFKSLQNLDRMVRIEQVKFINDSDYTGDVQLRTKAIIYYRPQARQG